MVMKPTDIPNTQIDAPGAYLDDNTKLKEILAQSGGKAATPEEIAQIKAQGASIGRNYPEHGLINKHYHDRIDAAMAKLEKPTVGNAIEVMLNQSNRDYFKEFKYLDPRLIEEPRFKIGEISHEIAHISSRSGHTSQMELTNQPFDMALSISTYDLIHSEDYVAHIQSMQRSNLVRFQQVQLDYQKEVLVPASKTVWAVNFAAGLYLREKLDAFAKAGLLEQPQDYDTQKAFSEDYRKSDGEPTNTPNIEYKWKALNSAPYDMIKLSKEEWRAIEEVALGMYQPDQTPYPKRMNAIKQALVNVGFFFDKPAFAESPEAENARKKMASTQHARIKGMHESWTEVEVSLRDQEDKAQEKEAKEYLKTQHAKVGKQHKSRGEAAESYAQMEEVARQQEAAKQEKYAEKIAKEQYTTIGRTYAATVKESSLNRSDQKEK